MSDKTDAAKLAWLVSPGQQMGAGSSTSLKKAQANEKEADKLFGQIDNNSDKLLSKVEIYDYVSKLKQVQRAKYTLEFIKDVIAEHDVDGECVLTARYPPLHPPPGLVRASSELGSLFLTRMDVCCARASVVTSIGRSSRRCWRR